MTYATMYVTLLSIIVFCFVYGVGVEYASDIYKKKLTAYGSWISVLVFFVRKMLL